MVYIHKVTIYIKWEIVVGEVGNIVFLSKKERKKKKGREGGKQKGKWEKVSDFLKVIILCTFFSTGGEDRKSFMEIFWFLWDSAEYIKRLE